jgi:ketosteroid isomerase-like protein
MAQESAERNCSALSVFIWGARCDIPRMRDHSADIRALRRQSNAAIASLDANYVISFMSDDIVVQVAGGPELRGKVANREAWEKQMAEAGFGGYVRTPDKITIADDGTHASEIGHWVGRWRVKGRAHVEEGRYTAEWRLGVMGWEIVQEAFVSSPRA